MLDRRRQLGEAPTKLVRCYMLGREVSALASWVQLLGVCPMSDVVSLRVSHLPLRYPYGILSQAQPMFNTFWHIVMVAKFECKRRMSVMSTLIRQFV